MKHHNICMNEERKMSKKMEKLIGLIDFPEGIWLRGDCLGITYNIDLCAQNVQLMIPQLPKEMDIHQSQLLPPHYYKCEEHNNWGYVRQFSKGDRLESSQCIAVVNSIYFECDVENAETASDNIYLCIDEWRKMFVDILTLQAKSYPTSSASVFVKGSNLRMQKIQPNSVKFYNKVPSIGIKMHDTDIESYASYNDLKQTFSNMNLNLKIKTGYAFLVQAYYQEHIGNYHLTLMLALTAVETCVEELLIEKCFEVAIDAGMLINRMSLGTKFDALQAFGVKCSENDLCGKISNLRNDLFHNKMKIIDKKTLRKKLEYIEKYLDEVVPDYYQRNETYIK